MDGMIILGLYFLVTFIIVRLFTDKATTVKQMLVGNRDTGLFIGALSIASTWIWAPALFTSSEKAYMSGFAGLFWFLVPNVITLLLFAPFAKKIRKEMPNGYTLSEYMGMKYSRRVKKLYLGQLSAVSVLSTGVQILAGSGMISEMTGIPFWLMTIIIATFSFIYTQYSGIKASIVSDAFQMIIMLIVSVGVVTWLVSILGGGAISRGLGGISGENSNLFSQGGKEVFLTFGLSSAIGLISGTFGDQNFWQLAMSVKEKYVGKVFWLGALIFAIVPLSLGLVGFIGAGTNFVANDPANVNTEMITTFLPSWVLMPFAFMVIGGLLGTVDSNASAIAALSRDMVKDHTLKTSRKSISLLLLFSVVVANIPNLTVSHLFLIYGTIRATTLCTTIMTLLGVKLTEKSVLYGVSASMVLGVPTFVYGSLFGAWEFKVAGSLLALLTSGIVALVVTKVGEKIEANNR